MRSIRYLGFIFCIQTAFGSNIKKDSENKRISPKREESQRSASTSPNLVGIQRDASTLQDPERSQKGANISPNPERIQKGASTSQTLARSQRGASTSPNPERTQKGASTSQTLARSQRGASTSPNPERSQGNRKTSSNIERDQRSSKEVSAGTHIWQNMASTLKHALHDVEHATSEPAEPFSWESFRRRIVPAYGEHNGSYRILLRKFLDVTLSKKVREVIKKCANKLNSYPKYIENGIKDTLNDFLEKSLNKVAIIPEKVREIVDNCRSTFDIYNNQDDQNALLEIKAKPRQLEETSIITREERGIITKWKEDKTLSSDRRHLLSKFLADITDITIQEPDREALQKWWQDEYLKAKNIFFQAKVNLHPQTETYCKESGKYLAEITNEDHRKNVDALCKNTVNTFVTPYAKYYKTRFATKDEEQKPNEIGEIRPYVCGNQKVELFELARCQDENLGDVNYFKISALKKKTSADGESIRYYYALAFDDFVGNTHVVDSCWTYGLDGNGVFKYTSNPHIPDLHPQQKGMVKVHNFVGELKGAR